MPITGGWGDHNWDTGYWGGLNFASAVLTSGFILAFDDADPDQELKAPHCQRATTRDLCRFLPRFYCREDLNPLLGTGEHHRYMGVIEDWLYGTPNQPGLANLIKSIPCTFDAAETEPRFLDALLLQFGFNVKVPLSTRQKRRLIPLLVGLYKQKGTVPGLERAFELLLGIPVEILPASGGIFDGLECGEDFDRTYSAIDSTSVYVVVGNPSQFEIGKDLIITDIGPSEVIFLPAPILNVVSNRVYFAAQVLTGTIGVGAQIFCDRFCDQLEHDTLDIGGCSHIGADYYDPTDKAVYTFYVDIERTVTTITDLEDGGSEVSVDDSAFIVAGSRLRLTDVVSPIQIPVVVVVREVIGTLVKFDPVSLTETIESGAQALNVFTQETLEVISAVVAAFKPAYTFHVLTRDHGDAEAEVG
jgi:phage tail-like protein